MFEQFLIAILKGYGTVLAVVVVFIYILWCINRIQRARKEAAERITEARRNAVRWEALDRAKEEIIRRERRLRDTRIFQTAEDFHANPN